MGRILCALSIALLISLSQRPRAATWYVDGSVVQSSNGTTYQTAFQTIQQGIDAASDGDTVIVAEGTYIENIHFNGKNIILRSTDPTDPAVVESTIIDGNQADSVVTFAGTEDESCVLSGFTIQNGKAGGAGLCGGTEDNRTRATIRSNVIRGNMAAYPTTGVGGGLVYCDGVIENNVISDNFAGDEGVALAYCHGTIQNNVISENAGTYGSTLYCCHGTIRNNLINGNLCTGLEHCNGFILNNLIAQNSGTGLYLCHGTIQNNTIVGNSGYGVVWCQGTMRNCIIWGNTGGSGVQVYQSNTPTYCCTAERIEAEGNVSENPAFVDPAGGDYCLRAESPCIDAGANYYWFTWPQRDLDGNCRLAGSSVDMGCYEWGSSPDADGDLLSDLDEPPAETDPEREDSDGDGLQDGIEMLRGSDPLATTPPRTIAVPTDISTVQEALCLSADGDEIIVAPGIYRGGFQLCGRDVMLRSTDPEDRDLVATTILDARRMGPVVSFTGDESELCVLAGFAIRNGHAGFGAGIRGGTPVKGTHATIRNNTIEDNSAEEAQGDGLGGGLAYCHGLIRDNAIAGNSSDWGGGLATCDGVVEANGIDGNLAIRGGGGLIACDGTIENNIIARNVAHWTGGGLRSCKGSIRNNQISENCALECSGGGLFYCGGVIQGNEIFGNFALDGGGLVGCDGTIENNLISSNNAPLGSGGGLHECDGTIRNNTIRGNSAESGGGVSLCRGTIENNLISGNSSRWGGGLMGCLRVVNNTIRRNEAWEGGGGLCGCGPVLNNVIMNNSAAYGGGLFHPTGAVEGNIISRNTATFGGGMSHCREEGCGPERLVFLRDNRITYNSAQEGGGLYMCGDNIVNNIISGNSATANGGGLRYCEGMIQGNTIMGNTAGLHGGGLSGCRGTIQSNLICGNSAEGVGGGLYDCDNSINNTVVANSASTAGGGLCDCEGMIVNCIIWGNAAAEGPQLHDCIGPTYSCIEGWTVPPDEPIGGGNTGQDPRFADPLGPDEDPLTFDDNDYRLAPDSPCIDTGNDAALETWGVDADGHLRLAFGATSSTVDMGSYEYNAAPFGLIEILPIQDGGLQLTWNSQPNDSYTVWSSTDLLDYWHRQDPYVESGGMVTSWSDPDPGAIRKFYRIEMQ